MTDYEKVMYNAFFYIWKIDKFNSMVTFKNGKIRSYDTDLDEVYALYGDMMNFSYEWVVSDKTVTFQYDLYGIHYQIYATVSKKHKGV